MEFKIKQNPFRLKIQRGFVYGLNGPTEGPFFVKFQLSVKFGSFTDF